MGYTTANLAALIGSRICHDLISPIGAISNGLELLALSGQSELGPEFELINDSCASANARIRFFRVAFGTNTAQQPIGRREITGILSDVGRGARVQTVWHPKEELFRTDVQLALLAMLCLETAMPHGGEITFEHADDRWTITAKATRLNMQNGLWQMFSDPDAELDVTPGRVQFALLDTLTRTAERKIDLAIHDASLVLTM